MSIINTVHLNYTISRGWNNSRNRISNRPRNIWWFIKFVVDSFVRNHTAPSSKINLFAYRWRMWRSTLCSNVFFGIEQACVMCVILTISSIHSFRYQKSIRVAHEWSFNDSKHQHNFCFQKVTIAGSKYKVTNPVFWHWSSFRFYRFQTQSYSKFE